MRRRGARALGWSVVGCAVGQALVWFGWAPIAHDPLAGRRRSASLGAFVFAIAIRMAGATGERKEQVGRAARAPRAARPAHRASEPSAPRRSAHARDRDRASPRRHAAGRDVPRPRPLQARERHVRPPRRRRPPHSGRRPPAERAARHRHAVSFRRRRVRASCARTSRSANRVTMVTGRIHGVVRRAVRSSASERLPISVSIGVACLDDAVTTTEALLSDADAAMYFAKAHGAAGKVQMFDQATRGDGPKPRPHRDRTRAAHSSAMSCALYYQPDHRDRDESRRGCRGAAALAASRAGPARSRRVPRAGRADGRDHPDRRMGPHRSLQHRRGLEPRPRRPTSN